MYCDLHTHSVFSDGSFTPAQIVAEAKRKGLAVALTDHNTVSGLPEFLTEAEKLGVTAVPGIEFSTVYQGKELHLLGLFVEPEHYGTLEQVAMKYHGLKEQSNRDLVMRLRDAGYAISYDAIRQRNPNGNINRAHIAAELHRNGYVQSVQEAFATLLGEEHGYYVPCQRLGIIEAIGLLHSCRAVPVLAHPLKDLSEAALRGALPELAEAGLAGMETQHSSYTGEDIALAEEIAAGFGLLPSGGSDFHGLVKPDVRLGTGKGNLQIPMEVYEALLHCKQHM